MTIKFKILSLIAAIGLLLSAILALISPRQAEKLGRSILLKDAEFITNLLAENLALGMQTRSIDEGAALDQALNLLRTGVNEKWEAVSGIRVFDESGAFVTGTGTGGDSIFVSSKADTLLLFEQKQSIRASAPLLDADKNILGFVEIDFSKKFLNQNITNSATTSLLIALTLLGVTLFIGILLSREVTGGILTAEDVMRDIAQGEGDLTRRLEIQSNDEVGRLQHWMNHFMDKIHELIGQVKFNADLVSHAAFAISSASTDMANSSEKQAARADSVYSTIEQIAANIVHNVHQVDETVRMAQDAVSLAKDGNQAYLATQKGMDNIVKATGAIGHLIYTLSGRTGQINEVVRMIDHIAAQTNLLAINASIEAYHAGDKGTGFMVVADEVRRLSEQTRSSTRMIAETIKSIQTDMNQATESMHGMEDIVHDGRASVRRMEDVLNRITATVKSSMEMIQHIALSFKEEGTGAREMSNYIEDISKTLKKASMSSVTMAAAAREMNLQTDVLRRTVSQFKLKDASGEE
ncbi:HAMP domain-containing protein [bacterium]|nr:HAMP domain-containing protein [bacterium]